MEKHDQHHLPRIRLPGSTYFFTWSIQPGSPLLTDRERGIVAKALKHFVGERYKLLAYVVMDDHIHVIVFPIADNTLGQLLHSWKSFTAHEIQELRGAEGSLWQKANYDRIIRNENDLLEKMQYILNNPKKRWPDLVEYEWVEWFGWE